jgi:plastocyanin
VIRAAAIFVLGLAVFAFAVGQLVQLERGHTAAPAPAEAGQPKEQSAPHVATVLVTAKGLSYLYSPDHITVPAGTTVTWVSETAAAHTVTSITPGLFNKTLPGRKRVDITFRRAGVYRYYCAYHPYMMATVVVTR